MDVAATTTLLMEGLFDDAAAGCRFDGRYRPIVAQHTFVRRVGLNDDDAADVARETLLRFVDGAPGGAGILRHAIQSRRTIRTSDGTLAASSPHSTGGGPRPKNDHLLPAATRSRLMKLSAIVPVRSIPAATAALRPVFMRRLLRSVPLYLVLAGATLMLPARALAQGNVWANGHDVLLHAGQNGYDLVVLDYLRCAGTPAEIPAASYSIAVIGSAGVGSWSWSNFTQTNPTGYPAVTFIDADATSTLPAWTAALSSGGAPIFECMVVLSHTSCGGCSLTTTGSNNLNIAAPLIQNLFNQGMDIWANAGADLPTYYDFFPTGFLSTAPPVFGFEYCATAAGSGVGLTCAMTACCQTHNQFAGFSSALTVMEQECTSGCPSAPTGAVITVAAKNITLGPCLEVVDEETICLPDDGSGNVCFTYNLTIKNLSGVTACTVLLVPPIGSPLTFTPSNVPVTLPNNGTTSISVTACVPSGPPAGWLFNIVLLDCSGDECCTIEWGVDQPLCDCLQLLDAELTCNPDGTFTLSGSLQNLFPGSISHIFFHNDPPMLMFSPDHVALGSPLPQYGITPLPPITVSGTGAVPGTTICFDISIHTADLTLCCTQQVCIEAPECVTTGCCDLCDHVALITQFECEALGGFYCGDGPPCDCPFTTGACCLPSIPPLCIDTLECDCSSLGGLFFAGIPCALDPCPLPRCPGDCNGDGTVGFADLLEILGEWGPCVGCPSDLNGDGVINFTDLLMVLGSWGDCP